MAQLVEPNAAPLEASVSITPTPSGYHTEVTLIAEGEARQRAFDTETCDAGVEAAALALALGSHAPAVLPSATPIPSAAPSARAAEGPLVAEPPAAASVRSAPRPNPPPAGEPGEPPAAHLSAAIGFDADAQPRVSPTAELGFALAWYERYWLEARAVGALPQDLAAGGGYAHFTLFGGKVNGCYLVHGRRFSLGPCLGAAAYRLSGEGKALDTARSGWQLYGGPTGGALGHWPLTGRFALRASLQALVALGARPFDVNGKHAHVPGSIDVSGDLGLSVHF